MTLLEVIVAMAIFLMSLVAIHQLVAIGTDRALDVKWQSRASLRCQSKLNECIVGLQPLQASGSYAAFDNDTELPTLLWKVDAEQDTVTNALHRQGFGPGRSEQDDAAHRDATGADGPQSDQPRQHVGSAEYAAAGHADDEFHHAEQRAAAATPAAGGGDAGRRQRAQRRRRRWRRRRRAKGGGGAGAKGRRQGRRWCGGAGAGAGGGAGLAAVQEQAAVRVQAAVVAAGGGAGPLAAAGVARGGGGGGGGAGAGGGKGG